MSFNQLVEESSSEELEEGLVIIGKVIEISELILAHRKDPTNQDIWLRILWNYFRSENDIYAIPEIEAEKNITLMQSQIELIKQHLKSLE